MSTVSAARLAAYDVITDVEERDAYANLAMPHAIARHRLDVRDAGFATELAYGTLRMRRLYEAVIARAAKRDPQTLEPAVRRALTMGVHQALATRVSPHAAVSQTVELVRRLGKSRASGLVNAVMRRVTEATRDRWIARVALGNGRNASAIRHSHPDWIVDVLGEALHADGRAGELEDLLDAHNEPARVTVALRPGLGVDHTEIDGNQGRLARTAVELPRGTDPGGLAGVRDGSIGVQDEGSQAVALALVEAPLGEGDDSSSRPERWLDMCAGPGGKAALLGALAAERGASLDALEQHAHRAELVRENVRALPGGVVSVHTADATSWSDGTYDRILLDVPCTGLGALRRRPEARWRRTTEDMEGLLVVQRGLLAHGLTLLKPGGVLAYVTCSPVLAETRDQVSGALRERSDVELVDVGPLVSAAASADRVGIRAGRHDLQLWTHADGTDSMYVALLRRRPHEV